MADLANYVKFLRGTPSAYEALSVKDSNTLYFIAGTNQKVGKLYLGDILVAGNVTEGGDSVLDSLGELIDVNLQGLITGQVLGYNGTEWVPMNLPEAFEASVMTGASADKAGTEGYVPAPQSGDQNKFLRGDGTWAEVELPSNTQIFEVEIANGANHNDSIATVVGDAVLQNGDIAIVKELIASGKRQYVAYVYNDGWKAMDGNYNAENVYFDEDITITQTVGNITATNGSGTIPAAGKNLKQIFEALWTKEDLNLSIDTPSVSFSLSNSGSASGEVGSAITLPSATVKITDIGSYEYGSKAEDGTTYDKAVTGITFNNLRAAFGATASTATKYEENTTGGLGVNTSVTYTADTTDVPEPLFLDTAKSYTFSYSAGYTASSDRKPVTNLGNFIDSSGKATTVYADGTKAITAGTLASSATWTATGYRKWFWGYMATEDALADPTKITSAQIRALQKSKASSMDSYTQSSPWVVPAGTKQIFIAIPKGKQTKKLTINNWSSLGSEVANTKMTTTIDVADARGTNADGTLNGATAYDIWYVNLDSGFGSDAKLALTWS